MEANTNTNKWYLSSPMIPPLPSLRAADDNTHGRDESVLI